MFDSLESVTRLTGTAQAIWAGSTPTRTRLWLVRSPGLTHECHAQCHVAGPRGGARYRPEYNTTASLGYLRVAYLGGDSLMDTNVVVDPNEGGPMALPLGQSPPPWGGQATL